MIFFITFMNNFRKTIITTTIKNKDCSSYHFLWALLIHILSNLYSNQLYYFFKCVFFNMNLSIILIDIQKNSEITFLLVEQLLLLIL